MLCSRCNKRKAKIHLTDIKDGQKHELDLCEVCAAEIGVGDFGLPVSAVQADDDEIPDKTCPHCGISLREFTEKGRLGCRHDYSEFRDELLPGIRRAHHADRHRGKVPARLEEAGRKCRILDYLREELARAVKAEQFERAAELRDRIAAVEQGLEDPGSEPDAAS